jgi:chromosome segregation ATPase
MAWIFAVVTIIISAGVMLSAIIASKKLSGAGSTDEIAALSDQSASIDREIQAAMTRGIAFASKGQLDFIDQQRVEIGGNLEKQKNLLKEIEQKLEGAQKDVESKESVQQEMKSAKEEDEQRLLEVTAQFNTVKSDSIALEQELSQSLKSLDAMISEVPMTADQRAVFSEISNAVTAASSRLRDLITDYQSVNERLENLRTQHQDLEDEYTKLVEQQLGA